MRTFLSAFLLLLSSALSAADWYVSTSFREPATDGLRFIVSPDGVRWQEVAGTFLTPKVGRQHVLRDPSVAVGPDGTYHLVWTSSWRGDRGFGYASSCDLVHWTPQRFCEVMADTATVNVWAPEVFYDDTRRQFIIVWASCIPGRFPDGEEQHKNNHRLYYTTTKDFRRFAPARLFFDPGFSAIDATIVKLAKDDYRLVFKDNTRPVLGLRSARATSPYGPWTDVSDCLTEKFAEGPATLRAGDWWYVYYDSYRKKIFGALRTKDFVHYQDQTGSVSVPVGHKHGTVFRAPESTVQALLHYNTDAVHLTPAVPQALPARHDGGLAPVVGTHNIQVMRAQRGWTYNHQPMLVWRDRFYMQYLSAPRNEHDTPTRTMLVESADGYTWSTPRVLFPEYTVPEGWTKPGVQGTAHGTLAVMHQRVGFYNASNGRLLAIGSYGIVLNPKDDPNDGNGIGRVVREVRRDGSLGPIAFVYYNHGFSAANTSFPHYTAIKDKAFRAACAELLAAPLQRMQWAEEADRQQDNTGFLPLHNPYKAFSYYTLRDGRVVGLWKHALQSISSDGGRTWREPVTRAHGFVNSNAKIWGQRLSDGLFATVYNPAEYRWPLAISLSADGLEYTTLNVLNGEVTPLRHGGNYKSYGPQYVRGIQECNVQAGDVAFQPHAGHVPPSARVQAICASVEDGKGSARGDGATSPATSPATSSAPTDLWLCYSNNKEDMWATRVPVPVQLRATTHAAGGFAQYASLAAMTDWNIYSPLLAPVSLAGSRLTLADSDPYDYARVERLVPATAELHAEFDVTPQQNDHGQLNIEFVDDAGNVASRIVFDSLGVASVKGGARYGGLIKRYDAERTYHIAADLSCDMHQATYYVDGRKACTRMFDTPVRTITRLVFRTGNEFQWPNNETPADQDYDLPRADEQDPQAVFHLQNVVTRAAQPAAAVLAYDDFAHYAEEFAADDPETTPTTITNADAGEWMRRNVPLFECPDKQLEQTYYFRFWSLRKHIKRTPVGYGMTEFLVPRSYADRYNLIACAIGHHVMESRWLRDTTYLHQVLRTWYRGNDGRAMSRMERFSSWNALAVYNMYKAQGDTAFVADLLPDLATEYARWRSTHRLASGLYWQGDVQDGMEESISGGRKKQYARPTINAYMWGNATALAALGDVAQASVAQASARGNVAQASACERALSPYTQQADSLATLINTRLWSDRDQFYETLRGDTLAAVREAIGYMPWYVGMPVPAGRDVAWRQLLDPRGFAAPYGLTTAEQRHPLFRSHGSGKCEWDGAIWPFATSQTLTALANYLNGETLSTGGVGCEAMSPALDSLSSAFFDQMRLYAACHTHRGKPYIGEYLDEQTGAWLMGDRERSRYYNHSTFCDLVITGLCGLRPQADGTVVVRPIAATERWPWFCLDAVPYRGHLLTIIWDRDGSHYHHGPGLTVLKDGQKLVVTK